MFSFTPDYFLMRCLYQCHHHPNGAHMRVVVPLLYRNDSRISHNICVYSISIVRSVHSLRRIDCPHKWDERTLLKKVVLFLLKHKECKGSKIWQQYIFIDYSICRIFNFFKSSITNAFTDIKFCLQSKSHTYYFEQEIWNLDLSFNIFLVIHLFCYFVILNFVKRY